MKLKILTPLLLTLLSITSFAQTTSTVTYYYGQFVDSYFYTVFKNGTEELSFMNPNLGEFGDGMGHIKDEYSKNKFEISYKPWEANTSYFELISIKIAGEKQSNEMLKVEKREKTVSISDTLFLEDIEFFDGEISLTFKNKENKEVYLMTGENGVPILNGRYYEEINLLEATSFGNIEVYDTPNNSLMDLYIGNWFIVDYLKAEYSSTLNSLMLLCDECIEEYLVFSGVQTTNGYRMLSFLEGDLGLETISQKSIIKEDDFDSLWDSKVRLLYKQGEDGLIIMSLKVL